MGDFEEKNQESENLITDVSSEETPNENYNNDIDVTDAETAVEQYDETGNDGHTSSIFPGQEYLLSSFHPYEKSINPYNGASASR